MGCGVSRCEVADVLTLPLVLFRDCTRPNCDISIDNVCKYHSAVILLSLFRIIPLTMSLKRFRIKIPAFRWGLANETVVAFISRFFPLRSILSTNTSHLAEWRCYPRSSCWRSFRGRSLKPLFKLFRPASTSTTSPYIRNYGRPCS